MKQHVRKSLFWAVILSEVSHVFCCVLPTLFSLISLLAGLGLAAALPPAMVEVHEALHRWELPIIGFSGIVLAIGWAATIYGERAEMHHHDAGCDHGACRSDKEKTRLIMMIASVLFAVNLFVYAAVHRSHWLIDHIGWTGPVLENADEHHHGEE